MLPLALKLEEGAETRGADGGGSHRCPALVGLLTLVVVPSLYTVMDDIQNKVQRPQADPGVRAGRARQWRSRGRTAP